MPNPKKLIEVAMPIKEISAESVRDKSIRHGHISTLHLWWARRPLPVCRAVVFASLVPDPDDPHCPPAFAEAVKLLLGKEANPGDPYKPYDDIPYTSAIDRMEDTLRNRLMMFIGKFSVKYIQNEKAGKTTAAKDQLSDSSLVKWDNKNNEAIIGKARKLIFVAHNAGSGKSAKEMLTEFEYLYNAIKHAEEELYSLTDRHLKTEACQRLADQLQTVIDTFLDRMPKVFDPFAGGGAIPLEAARLGCRSYGNDINPVAHIIQKGGLEFPQKYGKPIIYSNKEFLKKYGENATREVPNKWRIISNGEHIGIRIPNRLSYDVEYYAKRLLESAEGKIGSLYPKNEKSSKPFAYYWVRMGQCSNPSCQAEVPLLKSFDLSKTENNEHHLMPLIYEKRISFEIKKGKSNTEGWVKKSSLICPCCKNITESKLIMEQLHPANVKFRLVAVFEETKSGKNYRLPTEEEFELSTIQYIVDDWITERLPNALTGGSIMSWKYTKWGEMFTPRQLFILQELIKCISEIEIENDTTNDDYKNVILTYLAILINRGAAVYNCFTRWDVTRENIQSPFSKQAIAMVFDFPEANLLGSSSGSLINQLDWILRYIESESKNEFYCTLNNASSGSKTQFERKELTAVITDPPYYDAIAYADLSDFFYVWLKRTIGQIYPLNFSTPQTPKSDECTALKHHHTSKAHAKLHFEKKLSEIFDAIELQTSDIVSVMFAHQSTEAWSTLCNSILNSRMNITGSWAMDTELENRPVGLAGGALTSSVTVSCKPSQRKGIGNFKDVKHAINSTISNEVAYLYQIGLRGADLLTACFGQAVSEFGLYERVEKGDGSEVTVSELLELARESAFNALLKGFGGDDYTKFYIGWLQLYGFTESDHSVAMRIAQIGLSINIQDLYKYHILFLEGNKVSLGNSIQRLSSDTQLGLRTNSFLIDAVHKAMSLFSGSRGELLRYIARIAPSPDHAFWRVLTSLCEVLPAGSEDYKMAHSLLNNKDSLIRESKNLEAARPVQGTIFS